MIRFLITLLLITGVGAASAWVADNPGSVTIYWFDYRVDTSFAFLLTIALVAVLAVSYVYLIARSIVLAPAHFSEKRQLKHYKKGLTEITYSVAALAASDNKNAEQHTRKAEKLLGKTPLTLLLSAQIARTHGDDVKTRMLLNQMLDHKETEYLAARSLSEAASKQQMFARALPLAERASAVNPREKSSASAVIGLHIRLAQWQEALLATDKAARKGALKRSEKRFYYGLIYLKQGISLLDDSQPDAALANANSCLKYMPDFAPAIIFAARAYIAAAQPDKAIKLIMKHWKDSPHPELAATFRIAMAKESKEKQIKLIKKLAATSPQNIESDLAIAETAIKFQEWEMARAALKSVLERDESMRACKLMAYVEQGEYSDFDAAGRWLARSSDANPDAAWICENCSSPRDHWDTHCKSCGSFDSAVWREQRPLVFTPAS